MSDKANGDKPVVTSPRLHNRIVEATLDFERQRLGTPRPGKSPQTFLDCVTVKNTSASLPFGAVVDVGDYLLSDSDPLDRDCPWFEAVQQNAGFWGVMRAATPSNKLAQCQLFGRCIARVNVLNVHHTHAIPKAGETYFESSNMGPVKILRLTDTDATGVQECYVVLRVPTMIRRGITLDSLSRSSFGTVQLVKRTGSGYVWDKDPADNVRTVEAICYLLSSGATLGANRGVILEVCDDGSIEATNAGCGARDWLLADE